MDAHRGFCLLGSTDAAARSSAVESSSTEEGRSLQAVMDGTLSANEKVNGVSIKIAEFLTELLRCSTVEHTEWARINPHP